MTNYKLGRRTPKNAPAIKLSDVLTGTVPDHPLAADFLNIGGWQMLGNDTHGDCITPETRVLTADLRWVPAGDLLVGDKLLAFTEEPVIGEIDGAKSKGRYYTPAVVECIDRVIRPCYELEFDDGTVVRSSEGHRWLVGSLSNGAKWVETKNLKAGGHNASSVGKPFDVWDTDESYAAGYVAAALDGEGNLDQQGTTQRVVFSQVQNPMLDEVERCFKALDIEYRHGIDPRSQRYESRQDVHRISVGKRRDFLRLMGSVRPARLLPKLDIAKLGRLDRTNVARLVRKTHVGDQEVVMLNTTSRTYFAEGLTSHNCVAVTWSNERRLLTRLQGAENYPSQDQVFEFYKTQNPNFPTDDNGMDIQTGFEYLLANGGPDGVKPLAFAKVDYKNLDEVKAALAIFGCLWVGVNVQDVNMQQFDEGAPWDYQTNGSLDGGHSVICGGYDSDLAGGDVTFVTWGQETSFTDNFWSHLTEEAWVVIWPEHLGTNQFQQGVDQQKLADAYKAITGRDFPGQPQPSPSPAPSPAGNTQMAVQEVIDAVKHAEQLRCILNRALNELQRG